MPFVFHGLLKSPLSELLLCALSTGLWLLGKDEISTAELDRAEEMLLFFYAKAPEWFGTLCQHSYVLCP